jgi:cytosine/adenosine deaminase-related metal-dependent hydrolase/ubiquinone/menaquinone biosynthesis C-methylase UbiE
LGAPIHQPAQTKSGKPLVANLGRSAAAGAAPVVSAREAYGRVAQTYDAEPNPMLPLEQRFLSSVLPEAVNLDVIDLGCGAGRWLAALAPQNPRSLIGVDASPEMLAQARRKAQHIVELVLADCNCLPLSPASADLVICSFLTGYIADLSKFAEQIFRLLRPGGSVFVSDLHPVTISKLGWRRGFHANGSFVDVATITRSISDVIAAFEGYGFQTGALIEPEFGDTERDIFVRAGKIEALRAASGHPAIYILQLTVPRAQPAKTKRPDRNRALRCLTGARVGLSPGQSVLADVRIEDGRVGFIGGSSGAVPVRKGSRERDTVDLSSYLILPGLINSHDHLEFALFPRLGNGPYRTFVEWANDIYKPDDSPVREHCSVSKPTRLWWGGIRNLLSGVTTVCHHNPYVAEVFDQDFVVRVQRDFAGAHSLYMGPEFFNGPKAAKVGQPFIIHLAEGLGAESAAEIFRLARERTLDDRTVIVHGLGLDHRGFDLLKAAQASLVWCPTSNVFLFGQTHDRERIQSLDKVALGSDSPLTAQGDLLDELRFAHDVAGVPAEALYSMITTRSARVLRLHNAEGSIRVGGVADFIAVRDSAVSPAQALASLSYRDIHLVLINGCVQLASEEMMTRLPRFATTGLRRLRVEEDIRWIRAPLHRLFAETRPHLPGEIRLGGRKIQNGLRA